MEHSINVISSVFPKSGRSRGHMWTQGQRKIVQNLFDGCSNDKYSSSSDIIWTSMNFSCLTSSIGRTPARNIVTIPSGPMAFARRNTAIKSSLSWHLMVNEEMLKHIQICTVDEARL